MAVINGKAGSETLVGGADNDIITGVGGNDVVRMGAGDDLFVWNPGDGSDKVAGQAGFDTVRFTSGAATESISITAEGTRARIYRDVASQVDLSGVERILLRPLGGDDLIQVTDLSPTSVQQVIVDLAGMAGGTTGDGFQDLVRRYGTAGNDSINVALVGDKISVTGLSAQLIVSHADATDNVTIFSGAGNDIVSAATLAAGKIGLAMIGGDGHDRLTGSKGNDFLSGDNGNDTVIGGAGTDLALLGAGNDLFLWKAGHGNDVIEGGDGFDTLRLTGSSASESILITPNGGRVLFFRNFLGGAMLDIDDVERLQVNALGGADRITVSDLSGTDVREVAIDLAATAGGAIGDKKVDVVTVEGSFNNDVIDVRWSGGKIVATDLAATVRIAHADTNDVIAISGGDGDDMLVAASLLAGKVSLQLLGGDGDDTIFGSAGTDAVRGGAGNDIALLGAGNDTFFWSVGDGGDTIKGQDGFDTLQFKCDDNAEDIGFSVIAGHAHVTRNLGLVDIDLDEVERIRILALGGNDDIFINDLTGTGVKQVAIDLAGKAGGMGDNLTDLVYVAGTGGNDHVTVAAAAGGVSVTGLPAQVTVAHADTSTNDILSIATGLGNDSISAATLPAKSMRLGVDGGDGNDTITGGAGHDNLYGGAGSDILRGGGGIDQLYGNNANDRLEGGAGDDYLYGDAGHDVLLGGAGNDYLRGGEGNDTITGGTGNDTFSYTSVLDGRDVILDFDGNPTGGQDVLDLDTLFDSLGVLTADRVGRVFIDDKGAIVKVAVDADGNAGNGFELLVATLHTTDVIIKGITGADVIVGNG